MFPVRWSVLAHDVTYLRQVTMVLCQDSLDMGFDECFGRGIDGQFPAVFLDNYLAGGFPVVNPVSTGHDADNLLRVKDGVQFGIALNKTGLNTFRFAGHFDVVESLEYFFPDNTQLHFSKAVTHASVNAETK